MRRRLACLLAAAALSVPTMTNAVPATAAPAARTHGACSPYEHVDAQDPTTHQPLRVRMHLCLKTNSADRTWALAIFANDEHIVPNATAATGLSSYIGIKNAGGVDSGLVYCGGHLLLPDGTVQRICYHQGHFPDLSRRRLQAYAVVTVTGGPGEVSMRTPWVSYP
ncbi:hypothetical protein [Streptomyces sp. NPDC097981]|uniref:hypothetical protein n=1 Tax=Streptomyces sp. NPDC097981 TaxID=3155428 RepID=UPI00332F0153